MGKGDDNSWPLGICHRLIGFIINNLIGQGRKRVALGGAEPPCESIEVPIVGGSSRNIKIIPSNSSIGNGALSPEVIIDFRHIEEPEISTSVQKWSSEVDLSKKNGFISMGNHTPLQKGKERRRSDVRGVGKGHQEEIELPNATKGKEIAQENREKYKQKEKDNPTETTSGNESEEAKRKHLIRPPRPLLMSVASNINEKADAFIRSRKEAMNKNYSLEQQPRKL